MDISTRGRSTGTRRRASQEEKRGANGVGHAAAPELDLKKLLRALQSVRDGDFRVRLAPDQTGLGGKIADAFNEMVSANQRCSDAVGSMDCGRKSSATRARLALACLPMLVRPSCTMR